MASNPVTKAATKITSRSTTYSGKGMLTAELITCFVIVFIRIVADFSVDSSTGSVTSNVLHSSETYGPFPIAIGLIGVFFILSFLAASGGTKAKLAVIFGGIVTLALGLKSVSEIEKIASELADIGSITVPAASGTESSDLSGASNPNTGITSILGSLGTTGTTGTTGTAYPTPTGSAPANPGTLFNLPGGGFAGATGTGTVSTGTEPVVNPIPRM
jgi:hypothetical protein